MTSTMSHQGGKHPTNIHLCMYGVITPCDIVKPEMQYKKCHS